MLLAFGTLIGFVVIALIWNSLAGASGLWTAGSHSTQLQNAGNNYVGSLDFVFLMLYFATHLFVILLLYLLRSHPAMIIVAFFFMILLVILGAALSNAWDSFKTSPSLAPHVASFPIGDYILSKLPLLEFLWGLLTIIVGYGFARSGMYA